MRKRFRTAIPAVIIALAASALTVTAMNADAATGATATTNTAAAISADSCSGYYSNTTVPRTIRVLRYSQHDSVGKGVPGTQVGITTVDFKSYVKDVLPSEWLTGWPAESLKAGAIAVKTYAWYMVNGGRIGQWNGQCYDVSDDIAYQRYIPGNHKVDTDAAVDATWNNIATKSRSVFIASYQRTLTGNTGEACGSGLSRYPNVLSQWGSRNCAAAGVGWADILRKYYPGVEVGAGTAPAPTVPGGAAAVYSGSSVYHVYSVAKTSGNLFEDAYTGAWSGWRGLGGSLVGTPAVTYHDSRYDVFSLNSDGYVFQRIWINGAWEANWHRLTGGGTFTGGLAAVYHGGQYDVFAITSGKVLYQNSYVNGTWTGWRSIGGSVVGTPTVTFHDNRYDVFALNTDGFVYQRIWMNGAWEVDWHKLDGGGSFGGGLASTYHDGQYDVFAISSGKILYENSYVSGAWNGWRAIAGSVVGTPAVTFHDNRYDVFAVSASGYMVQRIWTGGTWGDQWINLNGNFN